ncbi:MAG: hypothetical protein ACO3NK_16475 [Prochlorotrichaceae cyanobacterium]|jgi:hypothetical protein
MHSQLSILDLPDSTPPKKVHNFRESLQKSHDAADLPIWDELYKQFFPGFQESTDLRQDGLHQRQGIDRLVHFHNGVCLRTVKIDEKARWFCMDKWKVKPFSFDIALEFYSDFERKIPGWVNKPLDADYIAYAVLPIGQAVLMPVPQIQKAWGIHSEGWLQRYFTAVAKNRGYTTHSVCVPLSVVFSSIGAGFRGEFTPII